MSDYISKSALIEEMKKGQTAIQDKIGDISVSAMYETINLVIDEINRQPTLDEKEIICKPFERVIEQLNGLMPIRFNGFGKTLITVEDVIKILKEECGISE